jgi:hypothetical protein
LEVLVARINAPLLDSLHIGFFHQLTYDTPQLAQFVARTPNLQPPVEACIVFYDGIVEVTSSRSFPRKFVSRIACSASDWQLSSLTQVCSSSFPEAFISTVERLYICRGVYRESCWQDDIEDSQWLEVLYQLTTVKYLYLSQEFTSRIVPALAGGVLPSLQYLFLKDLHSSGPDQEAIEKVVVARKLAGHPIAVSHWDGKSYE